jgi:hypothetical protein
MSSADRELQMDDLELEKNVDYVFKTPSGGILRMKNGAAIIIRDNDAEILSSLEEYHEKHEDNAFTWNELTNDQDKRKLYEANAAALKKIKWIEVEAVVAAAQKLEAAEKRKSLVALLDVRNMLDGLSSVIVSFPLIIFVIWGSTFGLEYYFGGELSIIWKCFIAGLAAACMSRCVPKNPGRVTFIMAAFGYLVIGLVIWIFG